MKKNRNNAGETLVEVMASMVIFLLLVGILQGAILYSRAAMEKSRQIRTRNEEICENLRSAQTTVTGSNPSMTFQAVSADGSVKGNLVFQVPVGFGKKETSYTDSEGKKQLVTFYLYASLSQKTTDPVQEDEASGGDGT